MADMLNDAQATVATGKKNARKEAIIRAAADLFARDGVKKTSIAKLMDKAQLTRELFYYYFKDKDELIAAVMDLYLEDLFQVIDDWVAKTEKVADPNSDFMSQIVLIVQGVRYIFSGDNGPFADRNAAVLESGHATDVSRRTMRHFVNALLATKGYQSYAKVHGKLTPLHYELALTGAAGLIVSYPELSDEEIAVALHAAMRGGWREGPVQ